MQKILFISFILVISSCNVNENEKKFDINQERSTKIEELKSAIINRKYKELLNSVANRYHVVYQWDTLSFKYSYQYKPVIYSDYQIIKDFSINDIYQKDCKYFISLSLPNVGFLRRYIDINYFKFTLNCSKDYVAAINDKNSEKFLLVKVDTIYKTAESQFKGKGQIVKVFSIRGF